MSAWALVCLSLRSPSPFAVSPPPFVSVPVFVSFVVFLTGFCSPARPFRCSTFRTLCVSFCSGSKSIGPSLFFCLLAEFCDVHMYSCVLVALARIFFRLSGGRGLLV
ncbi:unnamed protein product, partial [Ectocarpus sp. 12 AP-2014]